jgi:capping protein alpha
MSDEEYEEASPEQKLNIATYFIMSSPTGEVDDVVADVSKLVNDPKTLNENAIALILKEYNIDRYTKAQDLEGNVTMVSEHGKVSDGEFVNPSTGVVSKFDHRKRKFTEATSKKQTLKDSVEKDRKAVEDTMTAYANNSYKKGKAVATVYGQDNGTLTICVSGANVNLGNFWTGGWKATYTLKSGSLTGHIKTNVHYFEDGNVQLHAEKDGKATISAKGGAEMAKEVAAAIESIESDFQNSLEEMYVNMHRTTFKQMRRFLPINRMPMNWTTGQHSLAEQVSK